MGNSESRRESDTDEKQEPCPGGAVTTACPCPGTTVLPRLPYDTPAIWSRSAGESLLTPGGGENPPREPTRTALLSYASRLAVFMVGSDGRGSLGRGRHFCHGGFQSQSRKAVATTRPRRAISARRRLNPDAQRYPVPIAGKLSGPGVFADVTRVRILRWEMIREALNAVARALHRGRLRAM